MRLLLIAFCLAALCFASPASAQTKSKTYGPVTLSSVAILPSATGVQINAYDLQCSVQLGTITGTLSVNVEGSLQGSGGAWFNMGTLTTATLQSLPGPVDYVRFNVTACTSCSALAVVRCRD